VNTATRRDLLRVPGIGPKGAEKLVRERRHGRLRSLANLRKLRIAADRAAPFILLDGRRPPRQLTLGI
jgi:predicted DNA-binding helix-hairpin-helix protein